MFEEYNEAYLPEEHDHICHPRGKMKKFKIKRISDLHIKYVTSIYVTPSSKLDYFGAEWRDSEGTRRYCSFFFFSLNFLFFKKKNFYRTKYFLLPSDQSHQLHPSPLIPELHFFFGLWCVFFWWLNSSIFSKTVRSNHG